MNAELNLNDRLLDRLEHLETQMRWVKRISLISVAVLVVLFVGYRLARYRRVTAQEFILTDTSGRTLAKLANFPDGPGLEVYAASGERRVQLTGGGEEATLNLYIPETAGRGAASVNFYADAALMSSFRADPTTALLEMHSSHGRGEATLALQHGSTSLTLSGAGAEGPKLSLQTDASHACAQLAGTNLAGTNQLFGASALPSAAGSLCLYSPGLPALELADLRGNRAVLGIPQTSPVSDNKAQENSAASLNLEHKSGKRVHLAPQ
jgi:hypothetical protein